MRPVTAALILITGMCSMAHAAMVPGTTVAPALWLEANTGVTTSGSSVTLWADQSGNGFDATVPGGSTAPTLVAGVQTGAGAYAPVIRFDGVNNALSGLTAGLTLNGMEAFVVAKLNSASAANSGVVELATASNADYASGGAIVWASGYTPPYPGTPTGGDVYYNNGFTSAHNFSLPLDNFYIYDMNAANVAGTAIGNVSVENTFTSAIASPVVNANGGAFATINPTYYGLGTRALGGGTVGIPAEVDIAAVIIFDSPLSDTDRAAVEAYLTSEYVPEPASLSIMGLGVAALVLRRRGRPEAK